MSGFLKIKKSETLISQDGRWYLLQDTEEYLYNLTYIVHTCTKALEVQKEGSDINSIWKDSCDYCSEFAPERMIITRKLLS
jgi:hypothetical protein